MSWKSDQCAPEWALVDEVIREAVGPSALQDVLRLRLHGINCEVQVWVDHEQQTTQFVRIPDDAEEGPLLRAEARVRFRRTVNSGRLLFFAQMRLERPLSGNGYTGLAIRGSAKREGDNLKVVTDAVTSEYNVTRWRDP